MPVIKFDLSWIDTTIIILYFVFILFLGFYVSYKSKKNKNKHSDDFLLAGRQLTLPLFVGTLVATWYGNILGVGEFIYNDGIVAWVCFGLPYYIAAGFFAGLIAKKIRKEGAKSIPEQLLNKFGKKSSWIASVIILLITIPAAYILMLGVILQIFTGYELWITITIGAILSVAFLFTGGFKADVITNSAQFVLMYIGFIALLVFTFINFGSPQLMLNNLPESHLLFQGNYSFQYIAVWFIISLQTFVDPSFHQRCAAAKTPEIAQKGIITSIIFWILFDFLTLFTGLYSKAYISISEPMMSFPILGNLVLPEFWKGIFIITLLATIMSTLNSYTFLSAATLGNDILLPILKLKSNFKKIKIETLTRIGLFLSTTIAIIMAILLPSAVGLIYKTSSIAVPGLLFPLLVSYSKKYYIESRKVFLIMICGAIVSLIWTILYELENSNAIGIEIFRNVEPMLPGIIITFLLTITFIKPIKN